VPISYTVYDLYALAVLFSAVFYFSALYCAHMRVCQHGDAVFFLLFFQFVKKLPLTQSGQCFTRYCFRKKYQSISQFIRSQTSTRQRKCKLQDCAGRTRLERQH